MPRRREKPKVHGWLILDKPVGMTSTDAVSRARRLFATRKAGHAGTLDPLASGCLPIAFGEATKTVPFVVDRTKRYRFDIAWGVETDTDDAEGAVVAGDGRIPPDDEIDAVLPRFTGRIEQVPPRYSAVKVAGARAYDLARDGAEVSLAPREVEIAALAREGASRGERTRLVCMCGKGTYVRALARDLGRALGTLGHVAALRRLGVGPFDEDDMISLERLEEMCHGGGDRACSPDHLRPVETALDDIPALAIGQSDAARLRSGQPVLLRGRDAPVLTGPVYATAQGRLVALAEAERGELHPRRVFNLPA